MEIKMGLKKIYNKLWWKFVPGVVIKVKWPVGEIIVDHNDPRWADLGGAVRIKFESADPNDHYRPMLEKEVGKQGIDWNWDLVDDDFVKNKLSIKFRKRKEDSASYFKLLWG